MKLKYSHHIAEHTVELRAEAIDALGRRVVSIWRLSKYELSYARNPMALVRRAYKLASDRLLRHVSSIGSHDAQGA